jgi:hypothetical protein
VFDILKQYHNNSAAFSSILGPIVGNYESFLGNPQIKTDTQITIRNLMTHTSGFDERVLGLAAESKETIRPLRDMYVRFPPRIREVNKVMTYSNAGIALLGLVVELVSGVEFGAYIKANLFDPLEMKNTYYQYAQLNGSALTNFIDPMMMSGDSFVKVGQWVQYNNLGPCGSIITCAADISNYMIAQVNGGVFNGKRILTSDSIAIMQSLQFANAPGLLGIGFPWFMKRDSGVDYVQHSGDLPGYHTNMALFPDLKVGVMLFSVGGNVPFVDGGVKKLIQGAIRNLPCNPPQQLLGTQCYEVTPTFVPSAGFEKRAELYTGCYYLFRFEHTTWLKIQKFFFPYFCVSAGKNSLTLNSGSSSFDIFEDSVGRFRFGSNVAGQTYTEYPRNQTSFSFGMDLQNKASYLFIDSTAYERGIETSPVVPFVLAPLTLLAIILICILHLIFLLVEGILITKQEKKEKQYIMHEFLGDYLLNDDQDFSESEKLQNVVNAKKGMYDSTNIGAWKWHIMSSWQAIMVIILLFSSLIKFIVFCAFLINWTIINPTKMLMQSGVDMQLFISLPVVTTVIDVVLALVSISMLCIRGYSCLKLRMWKLDIFGGSFLFLFAIGLLVNLLCTPLFMAINFYSMSFL